MDHFGQNGQYLFVSHNLPDSMEKQN